MTSQTEDPIVELYRDSFPDFARLVRQRGGNLEQAKDCFHDALLIFLEKERTGKLQLNVSPKAYLLGIARICWLRMSKQKGFLPLGERSEPADAEDADAEGPERDLLDALIASGRKCLELLQAFYYQHASLDELAIRFGFNGKRSAAVQKHKCLGKVREEIKIRHSYAH